MQGSMGQCVMTLGTSWRPGWCVDNWIILVEAS